MTDRQPPGAAPEVLALEEEHELAQALRHAWAPTALDPRVNERLIELALEDPLAPPTEEEVAESVRLRDALETGSEHAGADLARALTAALAPQPLDQDTSKRLARRATASEERAAAEPERGNVVYVAFGAAAAVAALAAAVMLVIQPAGRGLEPAAQATMSEAVPTQIALSRSTSTLFDAKFEVGRTSSRIDRIAEARARDLRKNRYTSWGVR